MTGDSEVVRVLHVDDEPDFAELTRTYLEREDGRFEVVTAESARAGREQLEAMEFECVVSDYDMPGENGLEFLETVREDYPDLPFVLFTGKGSEEVASEAISAGVSDYLQKQHGTEQYELLATRIDSHVERTRAQRDLLESESHFRNAQAIADLGSWRYDLERDRLTCSEAFHRIFGTPTEWQPTPGELFEYVHQADKERVAESWEEALEGRRQYDVEHRIVTETGDTRWVRQRAEIAFDSCGTAINALGVVQDVTDRRERQRRVREERDRRQALFQNPSDAIVEVIRQDDTPMIADTNDRFCELFGYEQAEVKGEPLVEVLVPDDGHSEERHHELARRVREGERIEAEVRRNTAAGPRDFHLRMFPFAVEDLQAGGYAIYSDITERKERERELAPGRPLLEAVGDAMYVLDEEGRIEMANQGMQAILGTDETTLVGSPVGEYVLEADLERAADCVAQLLRDDDRGWASLEFTALTETGGHVPAEALVAVRTDEDGAYAGTVGLAREVSQRNESERELEPYQTMVDTAGDMVYVLDERGRLEFVNDEACRLTGYDEEDLLGEAVTTVMDESDLERGREVVRSLLADESDGLSDSYEWTLETAEGDTIPVESNITLITSDDGEFEGSVGVVRDVSERKAREEQLENFTQIVSHDLRNPLNIASGQLELGSAECESDHLDRAREALERMETLIADLLDLARSGTPVNQLEPIELEASVKRCWRGVATSEASLQLEVEGRVVADATRLRQLLENLVRNAVEHGGEEVTVTVGMLADESGFYVADDGPGLSEHVEDERLFETGYSTTTGGSGFGLSIVRSVAEAHDWEVRARNGEAGGARFEFADVEMRH